MGYYLIAYDISDEARRKKVFAKIELMKPYQVSESGYIVHQLGNVSSILDAVTEDVGVTPEDHITVIQLMIDKVRSTKDVEFVEWRNGA